MTVAVMALLLLVSALLQSLTPAVAFLASAKMPFLLAVPIYYALTHGRGMVVAAAILAGLMQDSLSLLPIGYSALCFVMAGLAIHHSRESLFRDSPFTVSALGGGAAALETLVMYGMLRMGTEAAPVPLWWLGLKMGGHALLGMVVTPVVWLLASLAERHVGVVHEERI